MIVIVIVIVIIINVNVNDLLQAYLQECDIGENRV